MAFGVNTHRVSLIGHLPTGEHFDTSFWCTATITSAVLANQLASVVASNFTTSAAPSLTTLLGSDSGYDEVRTYCYPTGPPTATFIGAAPIVSGGGSSSANPHPLQVALVASLRTGLAGRTYRGRMYLPLTNSTLASFQLNPTTATSVANAMAAFFTALRAQTTLDMTPVVMSRTNADIAREITSVVVNTKLDIQRRRANQQASIATSTAAVT